MPETITKQEALKRLAEWMGWHEMSNFRGAYCDSKGAFVHYIATWNPFKDLETACEIQARLSGGELLEMAQSLPMSSSSTWSIVDVTKALTFSADQRTRAIVRVLFGCGVGDA